MRAVPPTTNSKLIRGVVAAVVTFGIIRFAFWPAQLAHSPYRDSTLGSDLITQFFFEIPGTAWFVGGLAAIVVFALVARGPSRKKYDASSLRL